MTAPTDRTAALLEQLAQLQAQLKDAHNAVPDGTFEDQLVTAREKASSFGGLFTESSFGGLPGLPRKQKLHTPDAD